MLLLFLKRNKGWSRFAAQPLHVIFSWIWHPDVLNRLHNNDNDTGDVDDDDDMMMIMMMMMYLMY